MTREYHPIAPLNTLSPGLENSFGSLFREGISDVKGSSCVS